MKWVVPMDHLEGVSPSGFNTITRPSPYGSKVETILSMRQKLHCLEPHAVETIQYSTKTVTAKAAVQLTRFFLKCPYNSMQ
jgi:hypothetical protein